MTEELKPCPFCGGEALSNREGTHATCGGTCVSVCWIYVDAWNRRAAPPSPSTAESELPLLPEPGHYDRVTARMSGLGSYYTADQMRAYGQECARAALAANAADSEAKERDAARYRWLRNEAWGGGMVSKKFPHVVEYGPGLMRSALTELAEEGLDEAIDAAMKATQKEVQ